MKVGLVELGTADHINQAVFYMDSMPNMIDLIRHSLASIRLQNPTNPKRPDFSNWILPIRQLPTSSCNTGDSELGAIIPDYMGCFHRCDTCHKSSTLDVTLLEG